MRTAGTKEALSIPTAQGALGSWFVTECAGPCASWFTPDFAWKLLPPKPSSGQPACRILLREDLELFDPVRFEMPEVSSLLTPAHEYLVLPKKAISKGQTIRSLALPSRSM